MAQVLTITLDSLPVSINDIWTVARGHMIKSRRYRNWRAETAWLIKNQCQGRLVGSYALHVELCAPDKRPRDLDNFSFKALSDAAQDAGVIENDSKCVRLKSKWVSGGPAVRAWFISTIGDE
jgi:Holliday junction resolvase RusA-like endonuclease